MSNRVLITGASGLLGSALVTKAPADAEIIAQVRGLSLHDPWRERVAVEEKLDLNDDAATRNLFQRHSPAAVIHTAARTHPGDCEKRPDDARRDNVETTGRLVDCCRGAGIPFVFLSTDLVFDGAHAPYDEDASRSPLGIYARTKCEAEDLARAHAGSLVLRVSLLLGRSPAGNRSPDEGLVAAHRRQATAHLFHDEFRTPIHNESAAIAIWELLGKRATGLFNLAGRTRVSRWELGQALARRLGLPEEMLKRTSVKNFSGSPPRPPDCTLKVEKLETFLGHPMPTLDEMLELPLAVL